MNKPQQVEIPNVASAAMSRYKTRDRASVPVRVQLPDPATGEETGDWIEVISSLSDAFRNANDDNRRRIAEFAATNPKPEARAEFARESVLRLLAPLVTAWSFDTPCTQDAVVELLRDAPQLQDLVSGVADDAKRFFSNPPASSLTGSKAR
jgi:hypothetical protein